MTTTVTIQTAGHRVELKTKRTYHQSDKAADQFETETLEMNRTRMVHIHSDLEITGIRELNNDDNPLPQVPASE